MREILFFSQKNNTWELSKIYIYVKSPFLEDV